MDNTSKKNRVDYLLGGLSEEDRATFEERYFNDEEAFEVLVEAEHDLIDAYNRGELTSELQQRFEKRYLTSQVGFAKVEASRRLARLTTDRVKRPPAVKIGWWQSLWSSFGGPRLVPVMGAAVLAMAVIGTVWVLMSKNGSLESASNRPAEVVTQDESPTDRDGSQAGSTPAIEATPTPQTPPKVEKSVPTAPAIATIFLTSGAVRDSGSSSTVTVPPGAGSVRIVAPIQGGGYLRYSVDLQTPEGRRIYSRQGLTARAGQRGQSLEFVVAGSKLNAGDYVLNISGRRADGVYESVDDFYFRLSKHAPEGR